MTKKSGIRYCPHCNSLIDPQAVLCPKCKADLGLKKKNWFAKNPALTALMGAGVFIFFVVVIIAAGTSADKKDKEAKVETPVETSAETVSITTAAVTTTTTPVPPPPPPPPPPDPQAEVAAYKAQCQNIEFRVLEKNPDAYAGQKYKSQGQVVQIIESENGTDIRLNVTPGDYGYWKDTIYIYYDGKTTALDESIINIYGEVIGKYTYESQAGWNIALPLIHVKYIEVVQQ